jgi:hypothetical protein
MNLQSILRFRDYAIMKRYNNAEYAYVVNGLAEQILAAGAEKLHAPAEFLTQFQERCAILDNVVAVSRIADQTGEIVAMEKDIDNMLTAVLTAFRTTKSIPIPAKKAAARSLYNATKVYQGTQKLPQRQKAQTIKGLLLDLQKPELSVHIETLGLGAEIEQLTLLHARFGVLLNARANVQMQNSKVKSHELRQEIDILLDILMSAIWVHSLTDPSEEATEFINTINKLLADAETAFHQRKAKGESSKEETDAEDPTDKVEGEEQPSEEPSNEELE